MTRMRISSGWTLSSRIRRIIASLFAMQAVLLLVNNLYSFKMIADSSISDQKSTMAIYLEQMDNNLRAATSVLNELASDYSKNIGFYSDQNEIRKYLATMELATTLDVKMASNPFLECVFFSGSENGIFLARYAAAIPWDRKIPIDDYLRSEERFENDSIDETWHVFRIGNVNYLLQVFRMNAVNIGVLIRLNKSLANIEKTSGSPDEQYVFVDQAGSVVASGNNILLESGSIIPGGRQVIRNYLGRFFVVILPVAKAPVSLAVIKTTESINSGLHMVQYILIAFGLLALAMIGASSVFVNRNIVIPLRKLFQATKEVKRGNLDFRIEEQPASVEYEALISSFNNMVGEIKSLKIASYEEKLEKQKAELKYLQAQLQPHFYLNAINTISSLSLQNKNKEIRKFIMALSQYLRYLFTDNLALVTVNDEIDHAVDYIKLQQIKYPNMIFYMVEVDEGTVGFQLPKLMVQTFVENIFKHAFTGYDMLTVFIKAQVLEGAGERLALITIEDNGEGFAQDMVDGEKHAGRDSIGIENVKKTLSLTFGRDDLVKLSNREEGGARVEIRIPEKTMEGGGA